MISSPGIFSLYDMFQIEGWCKNSCTTMRLVSSGQCNRVREVTIAYYQYLSRQWRKAKSHTSKRANETWGNSSYDKKNVQSQAMRYCLVCFVIEELHLLFASEFLLSPLAATQTRQLYARKISSNDWNKKMHVFKFYFRFFLVPTMNWWTTFHAFESLSANCNVAIY